MRTMINDVICDTETAKRIVSAVISGVDVHGDVTETLYRTHAASREIAKRLLEEQELSGNADPDSIREELRSFFSLDED